MADTRLKTILGHLNGKPEVNWFSDLYTESILKIQDSCNIFAGTEI